MANVIVLRDSPDWGTWDPADSRDFLRSISYDENLVIDFVDLWDRSFGLPYRAVRSRLKALARADLARVRGAEVVRWSDAEGLAFADDDRFVFVDDDDAFDPEIFAALGPEQLDGWVFGSVRIGPSFDDRPSPTIQLRPLDGYSYTNNYGVSGRLLRRRGWRQVYMHGAADLSLGAADVRRALLPKYLSATIKHPCSTVYARAFMSRLDFRADPRPFVAAFARQLDAAQAPPQASFVADWLPPLRALMHDILA